MSTTYEKLGQYSGDELPQAPTDVVISDVSNNTIVLEWTNNSSGYTGSAIVIQLWQDTFWETQVQLAYNATTGTLNSLSEATSYRIRVAQLLDNILYPSNPLTQSTSSIAKPQNLGYSGATQTSAVLYWDGYDPSWDNVAIQAYSPITSEFETVDIIAATDTTYTLTGLTPDTLYYYTLASVIAGTTYSSYPPDFVDVETLQTPLLALDNIYIPSGSTSYDTLIPIVFNNPNDYTSLGGSYTIYWTGCFGIPREDVVVYSDTGKTNFAYFSETDCSGTDFILPETNYNVTVVYTAADGRTASGSTVMNVALTAAPVPAPTLYWTFDNTITDEIESLTLSETVGTASYTTGIGGANCLVLDDNNPTWLSDNTFDYASIFNYPVIDGTQGLYTVMFWWNPDSVSQIVGQGYPWACTSDAVTVSGHRINFDNPAAGSDSNFRARIQSLYNLTPTTDGVTPYTYTDGVWYHVAMRISSEGSLILDVFINGVRNDTRVLMDKSSYFGEINDYRFNVGNRGLGRTDYPKGKIQHLRVYDTPLTDAEITGIYDNEKPV